MPNPRRSNTRIPLAALFAAGLCTAAFPLSAATITVDSVEVNDFDDGICTLREAILAANQDIAYHGCSTGSGLDQIDFSLPPASTILVMNVPLPAVTDALAIIGPGEEELTIDGSGLQPIFLVDSAAAPISFSLSYLTVAHGHATGSGAGGAVTVLAGDSGIFQRVVFRDNDSEAGGGAIRVVGTLAVPAGATVEECFFESNDGGDGGGGAIYLDHAIAQVHRSTFYINETVAEPEPFPARGGGAISSYDSSLQVRTSTFLGNYTLGAGGAILVFSADPATPDLFRLSDSTLVENVGDGDGDDVGNVGGVAIAAIPGDPLTAEVQNNLIADNVDAGSTLLPDIYISGAGITTQGFNLIGSNPGVETWFPAGNPNANGDYVGTPGSPLSPSLSAFDYWGGPTPVRLPIVVSGGLVVDRGLCWFDNFDQRGYVDPGTGLRAVDDPAIPNQPGSDGCDIGAAEAGAVAPPTTGLPFVDGFEDGTTSHWSATQG
jgi:CSLREA domain-containing protein